MDNCIEKCLVLSTAHMPSENPDFGPFRNQSHEFGHMVFILTCDHISEVPDWFRQIYLLAELYNCSFVVFDSDGIELLELPSFDW